MTLSDIAFTEVTAFLANGFLEDFSIYIPYEKFMVPVGWVGPQYGKGGGDFTLE